VEFENGEGVKVTLNFRTGDERELMTREPSSN
jgi:hypothetical protein